MSPKLSSNIVKWIGNGWGRLHLPGKTAVIFTSIYLGLTTLLVYFSPRSVIAFLVFMVSALWIYSLPMKGSSKLILGLVMAILIIPVIGNATFSIWKLCSRSPFSPHWRWV